MLFCSAVDVAQLDHAVVVQWRRAVSQHALRPSVYIVNIHFDFDYSINDF